MPKLAMLEGGMKGMRNVKNAVFVRMPKLRTVTLRLAFMGATRVYVKDARRLERVNEIKVARRRMSWFPFVFSRSGFEKVSLCLTRLIVGYRSCNEKDFDVFDVSAFQFLRRLRVGRKCFKWVKEVKMVGMSELESVVIGNGSFAHCESVVCEGECGWRE